MPSRGRASGCFAQRCARMICHAAASASLPRGPPPRGCVSAEWKCSPKCLVVTIVFGLLNHGITIEMLSPSFTFTRDSINNGGIWPLMAFIVLSHEESKKKAERSNANWQQKRLRDAIAGLAGELAEIESKVDVFPKFQTSLNMGPMFKAMRVQ